MNSILPVSPPTVLLTNLGDLIKSVTPHFKLYEFLLSDTRSSYLNSLNLQSYFLSEHCDEYFLNIYRLALFLEKVRKEYARFIVITSGFRCPTVNEIIGGSSTSHHLNGRAVDIRYTSRLSYIVSKYKYCLTECIINKSKGYIHIAI